uniref:Uncharacterized protein n=1 Tax=Ciona savignyi TaxID=51511 RepID=H2YK71_CIOSA
MKLWMRNYEADDVINTSMFESDVYFEYRNRVYDDLFKDHVNEQRRKVDKIKNSSLNCVNSCKNGTGKDIVNDFGNDLLHENARKVQQSKRRSYFCQNATDSSKSCRERRHNMRRKYNFTCSGEKSKTTSKVTRDPTRRKRKNEPNFGGTFIAARRIKKR